MTPFQEFRLWIRRAPTGQRASAATASLVLVALLIWALIPGANSGTAGASGNTPPPSTTVVSSTPPTPAPAPAQCTKPSGSVPGITPTQIKVAVTLVNVTGLATNSSLGILPEATQKSAFQAVIDALNQAGGVDCRQIVPDFIDANPADQTNLQQTCLKVVQAGVFAVVDAGAYAQFPVVDCFAQHHVPYFGGYLLAESQMTQFYPYLFELNSLDAVDRDMVAGLALHGFFAPANGFTKLAYIYSNCHPEIHADVVKRLAAAGVTAAQTVSFNAGCTTAFTPSTVLQQAILKFKHAGVTNLIETGVVGDFPTFTNLAEVQHFRPKYGVPDESLIPTSYGTNHPNAANIDGAISISASRDGEERTPGATPTAETTTCSTLIGTSVYKVAAAAGNVCDELWMFAAAVNHAPTLSQTSLADGLRAAGSVPFSYPQGPNNFVAGTKVTYAGQYWRTTEFHASCACWQVLDPKFRPTPP